jgi:hypothetical protein
MSFPAFPEILCNRRFCCSYSFQSFNHHRTMDRSHENPSPVSPELFYAKRSQRPTTPPRKDPPAVVPHDTPTHMRMSSTVPHTSTAIYHDPVFVRAAVDMNGRFWGPVSVADFFKHFLNPTIAMTRPRIDFDAVKRVAATTSEVSMYDPLVNFSLIYLITYLLTRPLDRCTRTFLQRHPTYEYLECS